MTHVTCRLTAKNQDQLWNPILGNRVWATFFYLLIGVLFGRVNNGKLYANTAFPGLPIQVSRDGGATWEDYVRGASYQGPIMLTTR